MVEKIGKSIFNLPKVFPAKVLQISKFDLT